MGIIKRNMENIRNIVIISNKDGVCSTQIEPIRSSQPLEMALVSITHGPINNISRNNSLLALSVNLRPDGVTGVLGGEITQKVNCFIPSGSYKNSFELLKAIQDIMNNTVKDLLPDIETPAILDLTPAHALKLSIKGFTVEDFGKSTPWPMLEIAGAFNGRKFKSIPYFGLPGASNIGIVYGNNVESSYVNGKLSRFLNIVPLNPGNDYVHHEYKNPNYVPINVREFKHLQIEIADLNGNLVEFPAGYKTIICLKIRPINTANV